jgi:hypothetical protein
MGSKQREPRAYRVVTVPWAEPALFTSLASAARAAATLARGRRELPVVQWRFGPRFGPTSGDSEWLVVPESEWMALVSRGEEAL